MKKLNLNNQVSDDDEKLISLLKTSTGQEPSNQFVENTLEKFLILKAKQKTVHKPLRAPLYLMSVIGMILLAPTILLLCSKISMPDPMLELENQFEDMSSQLDLWYPLSLMLLLLASMVVVWIELSLGKLKILPSD